MTKNSFEKVKLSPLVTKAKSISLLFISILIVMLFLPWQQTTKGEGTLIPYEPSERDYTIQAPISGYVKEYFVDEDRFVKKGSLLFEMIDLDRDYLGKLKAIEGDIEVQLLNAKKSLEILTEKEKNLQDNLQTGVEIHDKKIAQIEDSLQSLLYRKVAEKNNYLTATTNFKRIEELFKEGLESKRSLEVAQNQQIKTESTLESIRLSIEKEKKTLTIYKREKDRFLKKQDNSIKTLQNSMINYNNSIKNFEKEMKNASIQSSRNSSAKVYATKDGYPLRVLKNDKDHYIKQGEGLIHFAPKVTKKVLLLKIRALDMPLVKKGLRVRVQFFGWPSLQVSGWPKITFGTFGGLIDKIDPISHEEGSFYVYVKESPDEPWPDNEVLKIGTRATAWVRLSTVSIWYEIWRLHNALPMKMVNEGSM